MSSLCLFIDPAEFGKKVLFLLRKCQLGPFNKGIKNYGKEPEKINKFIVTRQPNIIIIIFYIQYNYNIDGGSSISINETNIET